MRTHAHARARAARTHTHAHARAHKTPLSRKRLRSRSTAPPPPPPAATAGTIPAEYAVYSAASERRPVELGRQHGEVQARMHRDARTYACA
eukprot:6194535-Pleurochrysis_carterae.AAC.2